MVTEWLPGRCRCAADYRLRPPVASPKKPASLRIDQDAIRFKAAGPGGQTRSTTTRARF
jgi:uncharacterized protein (DUF4415 family)